MKSLTCIVLTSATFATAAMAAPATYNIDPTHTFPSFEADHLGGLSIWRGKFDKTTGTITLDRAAGSGSVDIAVDTSSVNFGQRQLDNWAKGPDFFDADNFAKATYTGRLEGFAGGVPTRVVGEFTLRGVTRPLVLKIESFKCIPHPLFKRELCGADASGTFNRDEFGLGSGKEYGFKMDVLLRIQVEALRAD
jgi:polyisoprenoid-binding protein YceI